MCKIYTNTRWHCNKAGHCKPQGKQSCVVPCSNTNKAYYFHPKAPPFRKTCDDFNALTSLCSKPENGTVDSASLLYRTLNCPTHHRKWMNSLQLHWDMEWYEQVIEAKRVKGYREYAVRKKWDMDLKRDLAMMELISDAQSRNDELYEAMFKWQANTITLARKELVETMKWE